MIDVMGRPQDKVIISKKRVVPNLRNTNFSQRNQERYGSKLVTTTHSVAMQYSNAILTEENDTTNKSDNDHCFTYHEENSKFETKKTDTIPE